MSYRFFIAVTAHNPLEKFDKLLRVLTGYQELLGQKDVFVFIDYEHKDDKVDLEELLYTSLPHINACVEVAPPEYEGFYLTWSHKDLLKAAVRAKAYDFYIYTENDMVFDSESFYYWLNYKEYLKPLNLEPGFCRFERFDSKFVPFDNFRQWHLNEATPRVWGDRPYEVQTYLTPYLEFVGFVSLGNPYMGMMILDQEMAEVYITSESCDPVKSFEKTKFRCWPIADRSSMGLAFEGLNPEQEHRRVVPLMRENDRLFIAPYALLEHLDTKYSKQLLQDHGYLLDTNDLFKY